MDQTRQTKNIKRPWIRNYWDVRDLIVFSFILVIALFHKQLDFNPIRALLGFVSVAFYVAARVSYVLKKKNDKLFRNIATLFLIAAAFYRYLVLGVEFIVDLFK